MMTNSHVSNLFKFIWLIGIAVVLFSVIEIREDIANSQNQITQSDADENTIKNFYRTGGFLTLVLIALICCAAPIDCSSNCLTRLLRRNLNRVAENVENPNDIEANYSAL